jgi:hypothetical protein
MWLSIKSNETLSIIENACINVLAKHQKEHLKLYSEENLKKLYLDSEKKITLEWQLLSYLDKVDWFLFCVHELHNWNKDFLAPFNNYIKILKNIKNNKSKYPKIRFFLDSDIKKLKSIVWDSFIFETQKYIDWNEEISRKMYDRYSNILELFNIEWLLNIANDLENIIKNWVVNKKEDYKRIAKSNRVFSDSTPEISTTNLPAYEAWKIAFAKIWYDDWNWNMIYWFDAMYSDKKSA